ncbi:MAG: hypothetical protein LBG61_05465 [Burkholderiales bacterium]|jgi:hypothetical protein|nr:hypothetical protein [Burkholderiales bacterium]
MATPLDAKQPLYQMLKDPSLRQKTLGGQTLMLSDAAITGGGELDNKDWQNIHFKDVDFYGRFRQGTLKDVTFEDCGFMMCDFQAQDLENVTFVRCKTKKVTYIMSHHGRNVVFENCDFTDQNDTDENNWGAVYVVEGEVTYKNCKAKHIKVVGNGTVRYEGCQFEDMGMNCGRAYDPNNRLYADVTIENCTFKNEISAFMSVINNLTIKNSDLAKFLPPQRIKGDLLMENSKACYFWVEAYKEPIKSITVKNCEFYVKGDSRGALNLWKEGSPIQSDSMTIENVKAGIGGTERSGGMFQTGRITRIKNIQAQRWGFMFQGESVQIDGLNASNKAIFENAPNQEKMPDVVLSNLSIGNIADLKGVKLPSLIIDGYKGDTLDLSETQIGRLEIKNSRVETLLDLTNAHVGSGEFSTLSGSKKIKVITKGSNLDVKDGTLYVVPPKA